MSRASTVSAAQTGGPGTGRPGGELGSVIVLAGGLSFEREVSLRSGRRLQSALSEVGVESEHLDVDAGLLHRLHELRPNVVFPALHGESGEDGALRTVLELLNLPYVGSDARSTRLAWDKPAAKVTVTAAGLDTPDWVALPHATFRDLGAAAVLDRVVARLGVPLMVKPASGGSALGAHAVRDPADLSAAIVRCFGYDDTVLLEPFVTGVEIAVSVLETDGELRALPVVEIDAPDGLYDYSARYTAGLTTFHVPARLPAATASAAAAAALTAHRALGLRDLSRTDLIVDEAGRVQFLEVNVAPGMTETSLLPMAVAEAGLNFGAVAHDLLKLAAARS